MKRHAIYFALALAGAAFTLQAAPLPAMPDPSLPLISFEAACGGPLVIGERARIVILNTLGGDPALKFIALVVQGIPRSYRLDSQLSFVDVPLSPLERAAVQVGDHVAKIPDLLALERLVRGASVCSR